MEGRQGVGWTRGYAERELEGFWVKEVKGGKELDAGRSRNDDAGVE